MKTTATPMRRFRLPLVAILLTGLGCAERIDTPAEFVAVARRHEREGSLAQAVVAYEKAAALQPDSPLIHYDIGVTYAELQQFDRAIAAYTKAIEFDEEMSRAYNNRAAAYARLQNYEAAIADCTKSLDIDEYDPFAWRNRGLAHHDLGNLDQAISDFSRAINIDPENPQSYLYRGNAYLEVQDSMRAIADFDEALKRDSDFPPAMIGKAQALGRIDRMADAEALLTAAAELGADVQGVELASVAPAPMPPPSAAPAPTPEPNEGLTRDKGPLPEQSPLSVVAEYLQSQGTDVTVTEAGSLFDLVAADLSRGYLIRQMEDGGSVVFSADELRQLEAAQRSITLIVISPTSWEVSKVIADWKPDRRQLAPLLFEMSVS